jgi:hypothetical protein
MNLLNTYRLWDRNVLLGNLNGLGVDFGEIVVSWGLMMLHMVQIHLRLLIRLNLAFKSLQHSAQLSENVSKFGCKGLAFISQLDLHSSFTSPFDVVDLSMLSFAQDSIQIHQIVGKQRMRQLVVTHSYLKALWNLPLLLSK